MVDPAKTCLSPAKASPHLRGQPGNCLRTQWRVGQLSGKNHRANNRRRRRRQDRRLWRSLHDRLAKSRKVHRVAKESAEGHNPDLAIGKIEPVKKGRNQTRELAGALAHDVARRLVIGCGGHDHRRQRRKLGTRRIRSQRPLHRLTRCAHPEFREQRGLKTRRRRPPVRRFKDSPQALHRQPHPSPLIVQQPSPAAGLCGVTLRIAPIRRRACSSNHHNARQITAASRQCDPQIMIQAKRRRQRSQVQSRQRLPNRHVIRK